MTVRELNDTAHGMGFKLMPLADHERLRPCICGCKKRERQYGDAVVLKCMKCGREASGTDEAEARKNWNRMVTG